ncbi:hypothetical protein G6F46_014682 [Rhizopus delemar]|nr:hypothetical protein G6F46_014682 [Rhizopus delemar]
MLAAQLGQLVRLHLSGFAAGHLVTAAGRAVEAAEDVHQRRLARTGLADDGHQFTRADVQVDAIEHDQGLFAGGEFEADAAHAQQRCVLLCAGHGCAAAVAVASPAWARTTCSPSCRPLRTSTLIWSSSPVVMRRGAGWPSAPRTCTL